MQVRTLVLCPLKVEMKFLVEALQDEVGVFVQEDRGPQGQKIYLLPEKNLAIMVGGHGKVNFALACARALQFFSGVKQLWCVGSAGALSSSLNVGDVILAEKTTEHDFKSSALDHKNPEFQVSESLLIELKNKAQNTKQIKFGSIASGDEDIVSEERARELYEQTGALAVAWEGAGGARACQGLSVDFVELRAITDLANAQTLNDFAIHLKPAMKNLAQALLILI
ncbi:MAG: 5'-methylthioadenosine/S-adenosylhomocysteine nucleosidase [Bdellovibrionaceae bacterium]|nr:5'-methylthioadenosine/S-adenosylhomocysteine nucleosidase [Pseudobdellovibrionaceae bacterium]